MNAITIPFHLLKPVDAINARSKTSKDGIDELASSIAAKGLIQPLAVRNHVPDYGNRNPNGFYEIIDGRRRWQAMQRLVKAGTWKKDTAVPVLVRDDAGDADALETSLMANMVRLPMHPVDQHEVFARLADQGLQAYEIAGRFGLGEKTVKQHLALGRLAPEIRDAWRKGKIEEKVAQAFTLSDSHELQVAAYDRLRKGGGGVSDWGVRQELAADRPRANGIHGALMDAYTAAGGTVSESLFEDQRYIDDGALLRKLKADLAETERKRLLAEGWSWVALADELSRDWRWDWDRVRPEPVYTAEETAWLKTWEDIDAFNKLSVEEIEAGEANQEAIEDAAELRAFTTEIRQKTGAVIEVYGDGEISIAYGVIKPGEAVDLPPSARGEDPDEVYDELEDSDDDVQDDTSDDEQLVEDGPRLSAAMIQSLTETLTIAAQRVLPSDPELALRAVVAALSSENWSVPVKVSASGYGDPSPRPIRPKFATRFAELAGCSTTDLLGQLAHSIAAALDLRSHNPRADRAHDEALRDELPAQAYLAAARELFNAADYFNRVPKALAEAALNEMGIGFAPGGKKTELAAYAAGNAKEHGWLPPELRHPAYVLIDPVAAAPEPKRGKKAKVAA